MSEKRSNQEVANRIEAAESVVRSLKASGSGADKVQLVLNRLENHRKTEGYEQPETATADLNAQLNEIMDIQDELRRSHWAGTADKLDDMRKRMLARRDEVDPPASTPADSTPAASTEPEATEAPASEGDADGADGGDDPEPEAAAEVEGDGEPDAKPEDSQEPAKGKGGEGKGSGKK